MAAIILHPSPIERFPDGAWPREVEMILSAMDAARFNGPERRLRDRHNLRLRAGLKMFADPADAEPVPLFTRDIDHRGLGFITQQRLPLGHGAWVYLPNPFDGRPMEIPCTLFRCREAVNGWYEGALYFNRPQPLFAATAGDDVPQQTFSPAARPTLRLAD